MGRPGKKPEESSQEDKELYRELVRQASDGIHVLNERGDVVYCSNSFAVLLGYSFEEALRLNVRDWDRHFPEDQLVPHIKEVMHEPRVFETKHLRKDGEILDVQINARGIELGGRLYLYASSRDITERQIGRAHV